MGRRCHAATALAVLGLILTTFTVSRAQTLNAKQSEALATYDRALGDFKSIRRLLQHFEFFQRLQILPIC